MSMERNGPQGEQLVAYNAWLAETPEAVRSVAVKYPPWRRYRMTPTDAVVGLLRITQVTEAGDGYKQGEVLFHVRVIRVPPDRPAIQHFIGMVVAGVRPHELVMMEPA